LPPCDGPVTPSAVDERRPADDSTTIDAVSRWYFLNILIAPGTRLSRARSRETAAMCRRSGRRAIRQVRKPLDGRFGSMIAALVDDLE
jgi:hypothetical protein